jgi:N-acetylneuraminic acid mutarotase
MIDPDQDGRPNQHIKSDTLKAGQTFESVMVNLTPERLYYIRSYVITGDIENPEKRDTAYNPITTEKMTAAPQDEWEIREPFDGNPGNGAISFTYKDELYVGLAHNEFGTDRGIYKFTPVTNTWEQVTTWPEQSAPSNAVAFVITNVKENVGVYKDYVYIGTGFIVDDNDTLPTKKFYRYNLATKSWNVLDAQSQFTGPARQNAIAFTIGKKGYVGLGTSSDGIILSSLYEFDPTATDQYHPYGKWTKAEDFTPGPRTMAATFTIANTAFVCGGMDENGGLHNDLWIYRQSNNKGAWTERASFPSTPRKGACGFTIEEFGYMGTGQDADSLCSDFWRYNPFINSWERRADFGGGPRVNAVGAGIKFTENDYRGYMGLGRGETNTAYYNDFWQYRP